jgi:MFS family permease
MIAATAIRLPPSNVKKLAAIAMVGTSIEWYDFYIYGTAAALVFPTLFFSGNLPPLIGLLAAFSTFSIGFIARPFGAIFFGHFGDRFGRKKALVIALVMMGVATSLIGMLPSYAVAGPLAPLLLMILRFAQGLAIGGQWGGAVLLVTETAPGHQRGFYGSFAQAGVSVGVILANLAFFAMSSMLSQAEFMSWGWRLPFVASVLLVVLALYIQLRLEESPVFRELHEQARKRGALSRTDLKGKTVKHRSPVIEAIQLYPKQILLTAGAFMALQVTFFILVAFVVAYGSNAAGLGLPRTTMLLAVLIGAVFMAPSIILSAAFSDTHGRRGIYITGAVLLGIWAFVLFPLIETKSFPLIVIAITGGFILMGLMYGPQGAFISELFGTKVRYSGASLGYQCGAIAGGAFAPLIATALVAKFNGSFAVSVYIACACLVTAISVLLLDETYKRDLSEIE